MDNWYSVTSLHVNKSVSFSTYKSDIRNFICMESSGQLSKATQAGLIVVSLQQKPLSA